MTKPHKIFLAIIIIITAGVLIYSATQKEFFGIKQPEPETTGSILSFYKEQNLGGNLFVSRGGASQDFLNKYFGFGQMYVYTNDSTLINCSFPSRNGETFEDIENEICTGLPLKPRRLDDALNGKEILRGLFDNCQTPNPLPLDTNYKYLVIYSWAKYSAPSYGPDKLRFWNCIKDNPDYRVISLNTDEIVPN